MRLVRKPVLRAAFALIVVASVTPVLRSGEQPPPTRQAFMRQKLEFSKLVLEGITLENYDVIAKNARALKLLSRAALWELPTIPNAEEYVIYTGEFQRLCDDLSKNAKAKNIDGATIAYLGLTMSCVNCHKYVRTPTR